LNPGAFLDGGRYAVITRDKVELKQSQRDDFNLLSFSPQEQGADLPKCGSSSERRSDGRDSRHSRKSQPLELARDGRGGFSAESTSVYFRAHHAGEERLDHG